MWSAGRRALYLTSHNNQKRQTSMPPAEFEPTIPISERLQTHTLDCTTTGTGLITTQNTYNKQFCVSWTLSSYIGHGKEKWSENFHKSVFSFFFPVYVSLLCSKYLPLICRIYERPIFSLYFTILSCLSLSKLFTFSNTAMAPDVSDEVLQYAAKTDTAWWYESFYITLQGTVSFETSKVFQTLDTRAMMSWVHSVFLRKIVCPVFCW
jgi:hypothetical protein